MNKFLLKGVAMMLCMSTLFFITSCGNDEEDEPKVVKVASVSLDKTTSDLEVEGTLKLIATVLPENANNKKVAWASSDSNIASVDGEGNVTAKAKGEATITATTEDGSFNATCRVIVKEKVPESKTVTLEGEIRENMTLRAIDKNLLRGFVYVVDGVTLTIEPGTVIKGEKASMGSLIVERGGKVIAEGTKDKPIVFTSDQPKGSRNYGDWGGIILCGKAPVNNTTEPQIEGGPRSRYGGSDPKDNSGTLKYVRIEFCGYPFEPNREVNGLTCGGVGSGTTLEYIQVSFCGDDSFEWFGGTVNAKHLIAYKGWDDEFDTDYGFQGMLQFLLGVRDPKHADTSKSNGFESDNDADGSGNTPTTKPIFSNVTLVGPLYGNSKGKIEDDIFYLTQDAPNGAKGGEFQAAMHIRRNSSLNVYNSIFVGWPYGLFLDKSNTGAVVKNVIFAGMWEDFRNDASRDYFNTASLQNILFPSSNDIIAENGKYSSIVADKIAGAEFTDEALTNAFFSPVSYKGAFDGSNDWTEGWANFDPNNTDY